MNSLDLDLVREERNKKNLKKVRRQKKKKGKGKMNVKLLVKTNIKDHKDSV